jgi:dTDP-4-amino-4,6-dideoxygalactose transaminase
MASQASALAINGGPKAKTTPYGTAPRFAGSELECLRQALASNTLFYGMGTWVKRACARMCDYTALPHAVACSSGSAAVHLGLIAAGIGPGDEVIVTPNTDSGSALGIIEEGAVPVFCDCDWTLQPTAASVAARLTPRTRAVVVVHLAGAPAPVDEIVALCDARGIPVVEDCAQSWGTRLHGRRAGTFGLAGCFSTNDYKHISTGDGGFVVLRDETLYRRVANYADKCYDRLHGGALRQAHHGVNYRMSELQGAVACAQMEHLDAITDRQHALGTRLAARLAGLRGGCLAPVLPGGHCTYWWTALLLDLPRLAAGRDEIVAALQAEGLQLYSYGKYDLIQTRLFQERVARPWLGDDRRFYPFVQPDGRSYSYSLRDTPVHGQLLDCGIQVAMNQAFTDADMDETAAGIRKVLEAFGTPEAA